MNEDNKITSMKISVGMLKRIHSLKAYPTESNEGVVYRALNSLEKESK